jgi:uncharacterized protein DUF6788
LESRFRLTHGSWGFNILSIDMAKIFAFRRVSTLALRQRRQRLLRQLSLPPDLIRGSVVERFNTCGKPNCACATGQKHGPFYYLTQCLAVGKVNKFLLKTPAAQTAARAGTAAFNEFYDRMEELSQVNAELLRREDSSPNQP